MGFQISDYCLLILIYLSYFNLFVSALPVQPVTGHQTQCGFYKKKYGMYLTIYNKIETSFFNSITYINIFCSLYSLV